MKQLIQCILSILGIMIGNQVKAAGEYGSAVMNISPSCQPIASKIQILGENVATLTWTPETNSAYIVEHAGVIAQNSVWRTHSVSDAELPKRSVATINSKNFYRVQKMASFELGEPIVWNLSVPNVSPAVFAQSTVSWVWDESEQTNSVPAGTPITNSFSSPGIKTVWVTIKNSDGSSAAWREWAVHITDSSYNLIDNGDFSLSLDSIPLHWNKGNYGSNSNLFEYPVPGPGGPIDSAAGVHMTNYVDGDTKWFHDDVPVISGKSYCYQSAYKASAQTEIDVRYRMSTNEEDFSYVWITNIPPCASWSNLVAIFTVPDGALSLSVFHILAENGDLVIDDVSLKQLASLPTPLAQGIVSIDLDDGWRESDLTAAAMLEAAGYRGTFYIVTEQIDGVTFLSWNEATGLESAGHEVGDHSVSHRSLLNTNLALVAYEITAPQQIFFDRGIKRIRTFAYPYGDFDITTKQAVREAGLRYARSVDEDTLNIKGQTDLFALKGKTVRITTPISTVKGWIDYALEHKEWLILLFHRVDDSGGEYSVSQAYFQEVIDYCRLKNVTVVTTSKGVELITAP